MSRLFAIMGSGETTPTMTATHRALKAAAGTGTAALLDTPYGFQENADDITDRALDYFRRSVNFTPQVASVRSEHADPVTLTKGTALVRQASWLFTGPGSPTYALRHWRALGVPQLLADRMQRDGVLIMSSAAALTVGALTVPVYEIYKVGAQPEWFEGMDLLGAIGLDVALIPHFDNAEGGNHDTRFCYLGETRLRMLESQLGSEQWVLGVDEHTALIIDLDADTYAVQGKGGVTVRRAGQTAVFGSGHHGPLDELRSVPGTAVARDKRSGDVSDDAAATEEPNASFSLQGGSTASSSVLAAVSPLADAAEVSLSEGDVEAAAASLLNIEAALEEWKGDTSTTDERDRARQRLHQLIVSLADVAAVGTRDPKEVLAPVVAVALEARRSARARKDFAQSDQIRDDLAAAGIDVRDTPDGMTWVLNPSAAQ
jgi:hypothetical protein